MGQGLRRFYLLLSTQTLSLVGSRMTSIGLGIWVFKTTGNTAPLLLAAFFAELPGMLGNSLAGVLVDRWDRRRVMMLADAGQAAGTLLLLLSLATGRFQLWHLYAISLLQGSFAMFQQPARDAAITMLVPARQRERVNAIQEMSFPLAGVLAPPLAGLLYALQGVSLVILVDLATFLVAVFGLSLIHIPRPQTTEEARAVQGHFLHELRGALRFIARRPGLLLFLLHNTFMNFMLNGPLELSIPYMITVTGQEALAGALMGVMSLGALGGAALIAAWGGTRPRMHTILAALLLCGAMFLVYGTARTPFLLGLASFLVVLPLPVWGALAISIWQTKTPPDMQGRIFAILAQLGFLGSTASFLLTGPLVDRVLEPAVGSAGWQVVAPLVGNAPGAGMGLLLVLTGLIILGGMLLVYAAPQFRRMEAELPSYEAVSEIPLPAPVSQQT